MSAIPLKILLVYRLPLASFASTISEHVLAFPLYSDHDITLLNVELGLPDKLGSRAFDVIVLHYSLFGTHPFRLSDRFLDFLLSQRKTLKVAFYQDEHQYCQERFDFINKFKVDLVYSLFTPENAKRIYLENTTCSSVHHTLPGYISESLIKKSDSYLSRNERRKIDVGYRSRTLAFFMGKGAQEKSEIGKMFLEKTKSTGVECDISAREEDRLYGTKWYDFLSNCKFSLGVEAGVSIVDLSGKIRREADEFMQENPLCDFNEVHKKVLLPHENNIFYRTISPRIFESAAFQVCLILFPGSYSGILKPNVHYIELEKDFSNFEEVLDQMKDPELVRSMVLKTYNDLIASDHYHYRNFIRKFDSEIDSSKIKNRSQGQTSK